MEIIPAILTNEVYQVGKWLKEIKESGKFSRVQIDFVDGEYNNNMTVLPEEVDMTPFIDLSFDAHLMVAQKNVDKYVNQARKVGFDRIISQVESISNPEDFSGLALDVHSPIAAIENYLQDLEVVVVMGVEPGFGGQKEDMRILDKISDLDKLRKLKGWKFKICVDGGVEKEILLDLEKAGADEVAVGVERVLNWA